jgi:hypothetical protein
MVRWENNRLCQPPAGLRTALLRAIDDPAGPQLFAARAAAWARQIDWCDPTAQF